MFCPSCGGEYRQGFSWCKDCETALVEVLPEPADEPDQEEDVYELADVFGEEPEEDRVEEAVAAPVLDRRLRLWELALVLYVGFGNSLYWSLIDWWRTPSGIVRKSRGPAEAAAWMMFSALPGLLVLAYVVFRQGWSLRRLGLGVRWTDLLDTVLLTVLSFIPYVLVYALFFHQHNYGGALSRPWESLLAGLELGPVVVLGLLVSAAHEELIVRAYLMTEVSDLTGSILTAVAASVVFQTLYHLYQGTAAALTAGISFLVSAIYYAAKRRIMPVIASHLLYNLMVYGLARLR